MLNFENLGHREALQRLGVLPEGQASITPEELAHNTVETQKIEDTLSLLRQEALTHLSNLGFIDHTLRRVRRQADAITTMEALATVEAAFEKAIVTLEYTVEQTQRIQACAEVIIALINLQPEHAALFLTPAVLDHCQVIEQTVQNTRALAAQKRPVVMNEVPIIEAIIEEKRRTLES